MENKKKKGGQETKTEIEIERTMVIPRTSIKEADEEISGSPKTYSVYTMTLPRGGGGLQPLQKFLRPT